MKNQEIEEKARELADMVGSVAVDENLPLEVIEMTADILKEDCEQIRQAAVDIAEEERAIRLEYSTDTLLICLLKAVRPAINPLYMQCLNLVTKIETSLLEDVVIDKHYSCQKPIETIIYDENMELYQVGELMTIWELPQIRRDVRQYLE